MARPTLDDPDFDEFNAWARWVEEHDDVDSPFDGPRERTTRGSNTRES